MSTTSYPTRPPFFSHRFVRVMVKTCLCQELGTGAFALLTTIVHTEDAAHYRRPTTWYNSQLMAVLGMSKDQLVRVRAKAIEAGWLHYEPGSKGRAGRYWVTIPEHADGLDDLPTDEGPALHSVRISDDISGTDQIPSEIQTANPTESRRNPRQNPDSKPATIIPDRIPAPEEGAADAAGASASDSKRRRQRQTPESMPLPDELDTPEARTALDEWRQHRREKRKPLTPTAERKLLDEWSVKGAARFVAAVNHSITSGWQGLFEPDLSRFPQESPVGQVAGSDALMRQHTAEALARNRAKLEAQRAARTTREGTAS